MVGLSMYPNFLEAVWWLEHKVFLFVKISLLSWVPELSAKSSKTFISTQHYFTYKKKDYFSSHTFFSAFYLLLIGLELHAAVLFRLFC